MSSSSKLIGGHLFAASRLSLGALFVNGLHAGGTLLTPTSFERVIVQMCSARSLSHEPNRPGTERHRFSESTDFDSGISTRLPGGGIVARVLQARCVPDHSLDPLNGSVSPMLHHLRRSPTLRLVLSDFSRGPIGRWLPGRASHATTLRDDAPCHRSITWRSDTSQPLEQGSRLATRRWGSLAIHRRT